VEDTLMQWEQTKHGMLVANLGAYLGVVERTDVKSGVIWVLSHSW
jgi:hypothetical protein